MNPQPDGRRRGFVYILGGTAVAGACGYVIQLAAPVFIHGADAYLAFSVFWSTLFLFVSGVSGVQQEVARATSPASDAPHTRTLPLFATGAVVVLAIVAVVMWFALAPGAFAPAPIELAFWFGCGLIGYFGFALLSGILYGLEHWRAIAVLTIADAVIRAILVTAGLALGLPTPVVAAFVAVPFALAAGAVWLGMRAGLRRRFVLDVGARQLSVHALTIAVGAGAMGVLVTGLPLLLRTALPDAGAAALAGLILVITVTRAPLIIPLMALQSFLIVAFRRSGVHPWAVLSRYLLLLAAATAVLAVAAWFWLPAIIEWLSQGRFETDPLVCAVVVVSGGLVGAMCITGPGLLAQARHRWFVSGWVMAAVATGLLLVLPVDMTAKVELALLVPPIAGILVHVFGVRQPLVQGPPEAP